MSVLAEDHDGADDELGEPRPEAWAYMRLTTYYEHAQVQWRDQLSALAAREGFTITRWWVDNRQQRDGLASMLQFLPSSGITAVFVPDFGHLRGMEDIGTEAGAQRRGLARALRGRQIFVLSDDIAPILPPSQYVPVQSQPHVPAAPPRRRPWRMLSRRPRRS